MADKVTTQMFRIFSAFVVRGHTHKKNETGGLLIKFFD